METLGLYNCTVNTNCSEYSDPEYCWNCISLSPPPSPSPPPLPSQNHNLTPYLLSGVCSLGVAFLILTTCAILLRCRLSRRTNSISSPTSDDSVFLDRDQAPVDHPIWRIVTIGLPESVIDSIAAVRYKKGDGLIEGTDCSVCLTEFEDGDQLRLLPKCSHAFHLICVDTWLRSHKNCPLCRAPVVNDNDYSSVLNRTGLGSSSNEPGSSGPAPVGIQLQQEEEHSQGSGSGDLGGIRIGEILKRNRALSDLGGNWRVRSRDVRPVRRAISLDVPAAESEISGQGISNKQVKSVEVKEIGEEERGSSMSRLIKSSTSIGRSLQKAPVSIKRSLSSSSTILSSFRRSKRHSSSSILPL